MDDDDDDIPELIHLVEQTQDRRIIPVTILTGFLGSGKTTLLNYILTENHGKRIAVIENELSAGLGIERIIAKNGIDGSNLADFFELNNGCICCTVKGDLVTTLEQLVKHKSRFDYILIETTGVANPGPIISELWTDDGDNSDIGSIRLDGVITIVDALNLEHCLQSADTGVDICTQIAFADRILLNKTDLISSDKIVQLDAIVRSVNGAAELRHTVFSRVLPEWVLDIKGYSINAEAVLQTVNAAVCLPCNPVPAPLPAHLANHAATSSPHLPPPPFKGSPPQTSPSHSAALLTTNAFSFPGLVDSARLHRLLDRLLYTPPTASTPTPTSPTVSGSSVGSNEKGSSSIKGTGGGAIMVVYRLKGVLHVQGDGRLFIAQGVHQVFDVQPSSILAGSSDDTTGGLNRVVVIGKHIQTDAIRSELEACIV